MAMSETAIPAPGIGIGDDSEANNWTTARPSARWKKLAEEIDALLAAARPRLVHLARLQGLTTDAADDVAQEALFTAWRELDRLRDPERFDAWLDGIARNVSRRYVRAQRVERARIALSLRRTSDIAEIDADATIADDVALSASVSMTASASDETFDLGEELTRQELIILLDRAMGHLSPGARAAVEGYYLAEESPQDAAHRLGLTINALETRLSRARQELRRVLSGPLRDEAAAFDLALDDESAQGWRQTRLWCHMCARRRLVGRIDETPTGTRFNLRCPDCWPRYGVAELNIDPHPYLEGVRSFRPAFKRIVQQVAPHALEALRTPNTCPVCGAPAQSRLLPGENVANISPTRAHYPAFTYLTYHCRTCGHWYAAPCAIAGSADPLISEFMLTRSRWLLERSEQVTFQGSQAICGRFADIETDTGIVFFAHPETLEVLATFAE